MEIMEHTDIFLRGAEKADGPEALTATTGAVYPAPEVVPPCKQFGPGR